MFSLKKAILDTSVIRTFYKLGMLEDLHIIFNEVRIPRQVTYEYLHSDVKEECINRLKHYTSFIEKNQHWFINCDDYDFDNIKDFKALHNLHDGEAEVFEQYRFINSDYVIVIDENDARQTAKALGFSFRGCLSLIAQLDIQHKRCDYFKCVEKLRKHHGCYIAEELIGIVYNEVKKIVESENL